MLNKLHLSILMFVSHINLCFALPPGFVYVDEVDSRIRSSLMYHGENNFIGSPIKGYNKHRTILTRQAAEALSKATEALSKAATRFEEKELSILIRDAYRPQDAVHDFIECSKTPNDQKMKEYYYPRVNKAEV